MMQQEDPFSSYRLNKLKKEPEPIQNSEDAFSQYRIQKQDDSFVSQIPRHAARIGSRVVETIGGIPGDIQDLIQAGVFFGLEKAFGRKVTPQMRKEAAILSERAPTSGELKEASEKVTKGFTKAETETEELIDEYATTVASLLGPMKFRKALGVAALGVGAKKGIETLGFKEGTQEAGKLGTMLISSMFNPKGVKQLYSNYYNEARKLAPEGTLVSAKPLENKLSKLRKKLTEGIEAPSEKAVLDDLEKVAGKIKDGKVDIREMMSTNRSINERMGDPALLIRGKNLYPELKEAVNDSIKLYHNPEFLKNWKSANEAFGGVYESQKLSRYIMRHLGNRPIEKAIFASIAETFAGYPEAVLPTIGASIGAFAGVKGIELMKRIQLNPTLRKYYGEVLLNGIKKNSVEMIKSAKKLEKELNKNQSSSK